MRACQNCGRAIPVNARFCPECGAEQHATVGLQKNAPEGQVNVPQATEPERPEIVERIERIDFDPGKAAWLCLLGLVVVCLIVANWNLTAALILGAVCGVIAMILMLVMG